MSRVTLAHIAERAGVSQATVSRVLNGQAERHKIKPETAQAVLTEAKRLGYTFPYVFDETQDVAKAYRAACTPDLYLFDENRKLVYRGQFDDSRPGSNEPVTGKDLREAVDAVLNGQEVSDEQRASMGCNIKWKPGNEPDYFG